MKWKKTRILKMSLLACVSLMLLLPVSAVCTPQLHTNNLKEVEVKTAVETWVRYVAAEPKPDAVIEKMEPCVVDGVTIAYIAHLKNEGYCICGANKLLFPEYLYSPQGKYDPFNPGFRYILHEIEDEVAYLKNSSGKNESELKKCQEIIQQRNSLWEDLMNSCIPQPGGGMRGVPTIMKLGLTTRWKQSIPYNNFCPMGDGGRTVVGCVATAMSQVMKYWNWPPYGYDSNSYQWDGDQSCEGDVGGWTLSTNFNHAYDWGHMANDYIWVDGSGWQDENGHHLTQANLDAVSVLCFETGVSIEMDYGVCGSIAWDTDIPYALADHFYYDSDADTYTPPMHDEIVNEITYLRPVVLSAWEHDWPNQGEGHCWVVYGYNESTNHLLMNMGWGEDSSHVWYFIGEVPDYHHEKRIIRYIAPTNIKFYQEYSSSNSGDGSPDDPFLSTIPTAVDLTPNYGTLIFKAGETYNFYEDTLTINKPITLRGYNVVIEKG